MAENLFDLFKLGFVKREWEFRDLSEDDRDWFRANVTAIISNVKNYVQETESPEDWDNRGSNPENGATDTRNS